MCVNQSDGTSRTRQLQAPAITLLHMHSQAVDGHAVLRAPGSGAAGALRGAALAQQRALEGCAHQAAKGERHLRLVGRSNAGCRGPKQCRMSIAARRSVCACDWASAAVQAHEWEAHCDACKIIGTGQGAPWRRIACACRGPWGRWQHILIPSLVQVAMCDGFVTRTLTAPRSQRAVLAAPGRHVPECSCRTADTHE